MAYSARMPQITYIDNEGTERTVEAELGTTVMETAINNDVPGILATCGGSCSCATCHVYVDEEWFDKLPALSLEIGRASCRERVCSPV